MERKKGSWKLYSDVQMHTVAHDAHSHSYIYHIHANNNKFTHTHINEWHQFVWIPVSMNTSAKLKHSQFPHRIELKDKNLQLILKTRACTLNPEWNNVCLPLQHTSITKIYMQLQYEQHQHKCLPKLVSCLAVHLPSYCLQFCFLVFKV